LTRDDDATPALTIDAAREQWMRVPSKDKEQLEEYVRQHSDQCAQADPFAFTTICFKRFMEKPSR
jgi:hypothetical protein